MKSFYLTTAIVYANGDPHIGFALEMIYTDVLARYYRMTGRPVRFLTGIDEHGQKIARAALKANLAPKVFVDGVAARYMELADELSISNNDFVRTTSERHKKAVKKFWNVVDSRGFIYKKLYKGLYCVGCESFKTEKDLVDGKCVEHGVAPEPYEDENYFFRFSAFEDKLKALFADNEDFVIPATKFNEMKGILDGGLEDISISRSKEQLNWGITVPGDDSQVIYVWFDALINYLTGAGYGSDENMMKEFWPADIHIIGKEINRFHSLLWIAMLMAAGIEVPYQIGVHGWITVDGKKMSKSVGNGIDPFELLDKYGTEPVRYHFMREISFHADGDFSYQRFEERYNNDLANELGNLLNRAVSMTERYLDGIVPVVAEYNILGWWTQYRKSMEELRFNDALATTWKIVREMNKFIDDKEPWKLGKLDDKTAVGEVMYVLLESLRHIGWMIMPVMPEASVRIFEGIGTSFASEAQVKMSDAAKWGGLASGSRVVKGDILFPRI